MTDFEKLMQNSETMRMLKIGNPERSKDFGIPDLQVGLFDIEQKTREGLEQIIYNSPDPDGAIAKHDTAIMLNNFGIDMETANKMAEFGFASAATGIDTREKTYWEALKNKAQEAYWTEMRGINTSLYRMTGDTKFLENADEYNAKALKAPLFESYGELGDLVLSGVQPTVSSAKFILTSALLSWIPGGVANKVWGPAVSKVLAKGGGIAANGVNLFSTGYSQAGNVLYDVMQMKDAEGNTLPWDSPIGGVLFHSLAGMMGLVELGSMEMFPWYRQLKTKFTDRELVKHLERGLANAFKNFTFKSIEGTAGESVEEGIQSGLEDGFTNALKAMANKDGAEFDLISLGDSIRKGTKAFLDAGKSMFLTSMLSAGIGQGVVSASLRAKAKKNFNTTDSSVPVDSSFVSVPKTDVEEEGKEEPDSKMDPIRVANVGTHLVPVDESEARKATKARKKNAEAMEVIVEDLAPMETDDRLSLLNRAAIATEGKILGDESIAFEDGDAMNRAIYLLAPNIESVEEKENGADIILRDENGAIRRIPLRVLQEGQEGTDPDISYYDDPESPYSLARVSEEQALAWEERETIKRALGDLASHTEGRISTADLESNVDAIKLVADTLGISTDQMLRENLLFKLVKASPEGERGYINNITVDGKKQYTIHLTERADASTLLHEIGHFLRGTATKEQIAEFTAHYGKGSNGVWIEDINKVGDRYVVGDQTFDTFEAALKVVEANEEAFADDFVRYLRTGEAPTEGLSNIFRRMKAVLQRFVLEFGGELDPEVKQMFDNLIVSNTKEGTPPISGPGVALKQKAPATDSFQYRMIARSAHETLKNPDGSLRVFFHGSDRAIEDYSPTQQGLITGANSAGKAFFFTDSEEVAQEYADLAADARAMREEQVRLEALMDDLNEESERITKQWHNDELDTEEYDQMLEVLEEQINQTDEKLASIESSLATGDFNSFPSEADPVLNRVYLGATNLLEVEGDVNIDETIEKALLEGYNGVYFRNISDSPSGLESDTVAIFDPDDIYSIGEDQSQPDLFQTAPPIESEAFKQWFGESKVVDENGNPLVVYHGTDAAFTTFSNTGEKLPSLGYGYYFTPDIRKAQQYGANIMPVYISAERLLDWGSLSNEDRSKIIDRLNDKVPESEIAGYGKEVRKSFDDTEKGRQAGAKFFEKKKVETENYFHERAKAREERSLDGLKIDVVWMEPGLENASNQDLLALAQQYDIQIAENLGYDAARFGNEIVVFAPTKIKSVNNQGTWDSNNPNILFQQAPPINSEAFKAWFKDSKVVDENGLPLKVYHVTPNVFEEFKKQDSFSPWFYFSTSRKWVNRFAKTRSYINPIVMQNYLSVQNPLTLRGRHTSLEWIDILKGHGITVNEEWFPGSGAKNPEKVQFWVILRYDNSGERGAHIMQGMKDAGYDGLHIDDMQHGGVDGDSWVVMDPSQIKAVNNYGTWDSSNPNILFQQAPPINSEAFKQWFGKSKVADENGNPIELLHGSPNMFDDFIRTQDNDNGYLGAGYYFTGDKGIAQTYATKNNIGYIYHAYLKMDNPLRYDQEWDKEWSKIRDEIVKENPRVEQYSSEFGKLLAEKIQSYGYDGVLDLRNGEVVEAVVFRNEQIRIASVEPYSIESVPRGPLFQESSADDRYFKALEAGDETTAQRIVDEMARRRGYISSNDFRMQHQAPNSKDGFSANLARLDESGLLPKDYWDHPRWYAGDTEMYSFWKVRSALDRLERNGRGNIRLYRAIPKNVREDWFRNGDWVTPDVEYARNEGRMIPEGYRIISHSVPLEHVWWDVNSIAELGYDDGGTYAYRNTKNNRKLVDLIVRDDDGNIVPPSKRFNYRSDTLYQKSDPLLKAYRHWEPEITSTGIIKGAPEWVKTRKDFNHMMQQMRKFLREGVSGRYWYEQSAEAVWRMMQGDPDKVRKFIQLLAIYSPNNNVPGNTLMAIRAFSHWAAGLPEKDLSSGMSELDNKAKRALYHGEDWEGRKTNSFYINLMYELVRKYPEAFPDMELSDVATMDLWMARAFGYIVEAYSNDKGSGKYSFSENITRRLAAEMNAKLGPLEDPWTPHQVQAAIWSSMKTRYELNHVKASTNKESLRLGYSKLNSKGKVENPTSGENEKLHKQLWRSFAVNKAGTSAEITKAVEETGFSFSEAIYDSSQVVTWESIPSESTGADITHASMATKRQFTREALSLIMDVEGNDLLASMLGVPINYSISSEGAYAGSVSPNIVTSLFPAREKGKEVTFDTVRKYAKAIQYIYKQDAVPFFKPNSVPLVSKTAREEMQFKVVRYSRGRDGSILKETTIPKSKVGTQAEAEQVREDYLAKNPGLSPEDVAVHGGKYSRAMVLSFRNKLNDVILNNVLEELRQYIGEDAGYTRTGSNEIIVVNYRDDFTHAPWMHDEDFLEALDLFIEEQRQALGIVDSASIYTEGEYGEVYNWSESGREETEKALEGGFAGRPDLQAWIRDRRTHYEKLLERYSGEQLRRTEERLRTSLFQKAPPVGSVAFDEKFKNTKIKDANGNPLMVYHGSASLFTDYSSRLLGRNTDALDALQGHFFSTSKDTAESYAVSAMPPRALILKQLREELYQKLHDRGLSPTADDPVVRQINWVDSSLEDIEDLIDRGAQSWDPTIIGAYVNLENPVEIDLTDPTVSDEWIGMIAQARQDGHDGVILINDRFTDENTIIVFDDANIGSSAYYLESEGFEEEHEFTHEIDMDSMLKGIDVEVRGELEIIRHDDNENYDEDNLQRIINVIDEELMDLKPESGVDQKYDSQFPDQSLFGLGKAASKELPGWGPLRGDPTQWGYDGTESSPIIDGDWSRFRKIDFKGTKVRSSTDLAKLFSIYRNPKVEYFHVIITKDIGEGAVEILEHHALTSGLPGMTIGVSSRFPKDILEMMIDRRADGFFLLHNHPSGNVKPSKEDFGVSQNYRENIPGFKGHIILDHNKFSMIKSDMSTELYTFLSGEGFHKVPMQSRTSLGVSYSHETVGQYALSVMKDRKGILLYVNTQNEVLDVQPIEDTVDFDDVFATIKREGYVYVFVVTSDETLYEKAIADGEERYQNEGVFVRDVILVKDNGFVSALQSAEIYSTSIFSWQQREYRRRHRNHEFDNYVFESSPTLYQLSEEAKQEVLRRRADEVKKAVQAYYWIPDKILEEYAGQEWADRELQFRERLKEFPQLLSMAKEYVDLDEYLEYMRGEVGPWPAADESFYRRVHAYSRIMTPKEKDAQFVRLHTGTDKALIALGRTLKGYLDVDPKLDRVVHRWGSFKGVSTFVKQLDADSTAEEIQRARALVQQDPRPYRRALQYIEQAEDRVKAYRGELPSGHADREAYYDSLGEDIQEALDSPMTYDDMSDREVAAHLRTTSDKRDQYNARERLATHNGVLALERQANKELKELGAQAKRDIRIVKEELSQAQKELADTKHALEEQGESLKELEEKARENGDTAQLKKALEERRERVKDLRSQLTKANERTRALTSRVETLEKREASRKLRDEIERLQKRIKEKIVFRPETLDASYEPMFSAIQRLFGEKMYPVNLPEQMGQYFGSDMMKMIMYGKPIGEWSLEDLGALLDGTHLMRLDARVMLERRILERQNRLQNIAVQIYRQSYGENPEINPGYGSVVGDILDDLTTKREQYQESTFAVIFNTIKSSIGKMQRIARMLDGNKEGYLYDLLVRQAYEKQTEELRESLRRIEEADKVMKELGIDNRALAKDAYTYTMYSGQKKTLTKGEVIGLYVYSQNPIGMQKLIHNRGNGISLDQINEAIDTLTEKEKKWGDYMIDSLGGDETWERMRDVYYEVYNQNLGRRERYFTFIADGVEDEGNMDIINGAMRESLRWVDKGMTKPVNVHAIYPLKLNVTHTYTSQIKRQEHFIQWADWVRDMNYLMVRGTVGQNIRMRFGKRYYDQVLEYIKDVGSPQSIMDDIEKLGSKIVSNAAVAALSLNFLTMLKQLPSFSAAIRGDIGAIELAQAALRLTNPRTNKQAIEFIHEMSPYMKKRAISVEVEKYQATDFDGAFSSKVQEFNEKIGMKGIQMMDHAAVYTLWLAAYDTYIRRNPENMAEQALRKEAAFRATQLISETQPTSITTDLAGVQRKKSPWVRTALLFTNQIFQYINMVWYDLPTSWKNYQMTKDPQQIRKMFGIVMNMAISGGLIILVSGAAFRRDGEDDDEYWKRLRNEVFSMIASYSLPYVGSMVSQGLSGFYGGDLVDLPSAFGRALGTDWTDWEKMNKRIWDLLDGVGAIQGLPTAFINRAIKAYEGRNPFELFGANYGRLWEDQ